VETRVFQQQPLEEEATRPASLRSAEPNGGSVVGEVGLGAFGIGS
jgi:hypothetical protein